MSKKKGRDRMLGKLTRGGQISIPAPLREDMGIQEGAFFEFERQGNKIVLTPLELVPAKSSRKRGG